jgi:flagellar hook-length control protein FliK
LLFPASIPHALAGAPPATAVAGTQKDQKLSTSTVQPAAKTDSDSSAAPGNSGADKPAAASAAAAPASTLASTAASAPLSTPGTASAVPAAAGMTGASHNDPRSNPAAAGALSSQTALAQRSEDGPELSPGLQAWNGGENTAASLASSERLAGTVAAAQMNVALRTEEMGAVQVHARVTGDLVGAAITVERPGAHAALASDLPALRQALSERQLRVENLALFQGSPQAGAGIGGGTGRQQHQDGASARPAPAASAPTPFAGAADGPGDFEAPETRTAFDTNGRLSVQA